MAEVYGPQGWWPVQCERKAYMDAQGPIEQQGYHPGQFDFPRTRQGRWEICCGALLTQNTAWSNVRSALTGLRERKFLTPEQLLSAPLAAVKDAIRPAGYFNQKSGYLCAVAEWFLQGDRNFCRSPRSRKLLEASRPELLRVRGVGPETADSILLYAYALPTFVVDTYTRRVFSRLSIVEADWNYERIRSLFEGALRRPTVTDTVELWQEAHALIVEHAKRHHGRSADAKDDFLLGLG
jgi:endonuclease-3 related protein